VRTAEEIRDHLVELAQLAVRRPSMWAVNGFDLQGIVGLLMDSALYAEGRDQEAQERREHLRRYGKEGVVGPFRALLRSEKDLLNEVAAVMAHQLHRVGYLEVDRVLDDVRFEEVRGAMRDRFDEVDLFASEILADLGGPTFRVRDRVWAYGSASLEAGWIFLSFRPDPPSTYEPGSGEWTSPGPQDRLLRFAWTSEGPFDETFALSTYTKLETWGPGWTWNHCWRTTDEAPPGVREALQAIHDGDPSQRFRRPGFAE
jgi:hypothetical protein